MERLTGDVWCSAHLGGAGKWLAADSFTDSQKKKPNNIKRCVACIAATKAAKTSAGATPPSAAQPTQPRLSGAPRPTPQVRPIRTTHTHCHRPRPLFLLICVLSFAVQGGNEGPCGIHGPSAMGLRRGQARVHRLHAERVPRGLLKDPEVFPWNERYK